MPRSICRKFENNSRERAGRVRRLPAIIRGTALILLLAFAVYNSQFLTD